MRKPRQLSLKATLLLTLMAICWTAQQSWALPPIQHHAKGVVQDIHPASKTLTLEPEDDDRIRSFVWNDGTDFERDGQEVALAAIRRGMTVRVVYRKEPGRLVLREVRVEIEVKTSRTKPGPGFL